MEHRYKCDTPEELWELCETINKHNGIWAYKKYVKEDIFKEWGQWKGLVYTKGEGYTRWTGHIGLHDNAGLLYTTPKEFFIVSDLIITPWADSKLTHHFGSYVKW